MEPMAERSRGLVKDRSRSGVNVMTASVAGIGRAGLHSVEATFLLALGANRVFPIGGVQVPPEPIKAGDIVGEVFEEVHDGVGSIAGVRSFRVVSVYWGHGNNLPCGDTYCQGIIT